MFEDDVYVPPEPETVPPEDETPEPTLGLSAEDALAALEAAEAVTRVEQQHAADSIDELSETETLDQAVAASKASNLALARQLALAAHWADLNAVVEGPTTSRRSAGEQLIRPGGDGTPSLAEFSCAELGAELKVSANTAYALLADALDLRHRLPMLEARTQAGRVPVWTARKIAVRTRSLSKHAAAEVDAEVAELAGRVPFRRLHKIVEAARIRTDPRQATEEAQQAEDGRGVWIDNGEPSDLSTQQTPGHGSVFGRAALPDLEAFDRALGVVAEALRRLGDTESLDARRAKALGVLADPATALRLLEQASTARGGPRLALKEAVLYVHLSLRDLVLLVGLAHLLTGALTEPPTLQPGELPAPGELPQLSGAVARVEEVGPVLAELVRRWLHQAHVTLKPVIDPDRTPAVDRYEVPRTLAEALRATQPGDCFPHAPGLDGKMDIDHIERYVPPDEDGPPGQTGLHNLMHLRRRHHRIKTFGRWAVQRLRDGALLWRAPHGAYYLVDGGGTTNLGRLD